MQLSSTDVLKLMTNKNRDPLRRHVGTNETDYELHVGSKLDFKIYFNTKQVRHSEIKYQTK